MKIKEIWAAFKWYRKHKDKLPRLAQEGRDIGIVLKRAKKDDKITKDELKEVLVEVNQFIEFIIEEMLD